MKHKSFLKSALIVSIGGMAAKGIGALYRIPLTNLLGGYGMGLYQMAYPFFCVLLTFSSAGIPSAFARMIAREHASGSGHGGTVRAALGVFFALGLCGALIMCLLAPDMSALQGDESLINCYYALAPSVLLVALIAVFRGYFQGKNDMKPTAVSEIFEQTVKAAAGLFFALRFREDPMRAVAYTLIAVTLSEAFALAYLILRYRGEERKTFPSRAHATGGEIVRAAFPVMAAAALLPLSQMADSVIIVRLLSRYSTRAVSLYGLYAGGAVSLVNLPASVCYGLAAAAVPAVSEAFARGDREGGKRKAMFALGITLFLSAPCAAGLFLFARPIVSLLYSSLSQEDAQTLVTLVRLSAVSAASLSCVQTLSACLTGMGKAKYAAFSMLIAVTVEFALQWLLLPRPSLSVGGAAIASAACYLIAFFLDLFYTVTEKHGGRKHDHGCEFGRRKKRLDGAGAQGDRMRG